MIPFEGPHYYIGSISSCQASKGVVALQRADSPRVYTPGLLPQSPLVCGGTVGLSLLASSGWALSPWGGLCGGVVAANASSVASNLCLGRVGAAAHTRPVRTPPAITAAGRAATAPAPPARRSAVARFTLCSHHGNRVDVYLVGGKVEGWVDVSPGGGIGTGGGSSGN